MMKKRKLKGINGDFNRLVGRVRPLFRTCSTTVFVHSHTTRTRDQHKMYGEMGRRGGKKESGNQLLQQSPFILPYHGLTSPEKWIICCESSKSSTTERKFTTMNFWPS